MCHLHVSLTLPEDYFKYCIKHLNSINTWFDILWVERTIFHVSLFMMTLIHTKRNSVCCRVPFFAEFHKQNPADVESAAGQVTSAWKESYRWALPSPPQKSLTLGRATNSGTWNLACLLRCLSCLETTGTSFYSGHFLAFCGVEWAWVCYRFSGRCLPK